MIKIENYSYSLTKNKFYNLSKYFDINLNINIFFVLIVFNFLSYSFYAVLSRYQIFIIEILININFLVFFFFYKKKNDDELSIKLNFYISEIIFIILLFIFLIIITFSELTVPLFGDELASTRRSIRNSYFFSYLILNIFNISGLKEIPFKFIIHFFSFFQLLFIWLIIYLIKRQNFLLFFLIIFLNFALRYIIKDAVHHPPLNHIFTTAFVSFFGLNHVVVRLSYLVPFWIFLIFLYKFISKYLGKKQSAVFILCISTFPILNLASVIPDHSFWSSLIFTFLLIYINFKYSINYKICFLILSLGILFRISVFSAFVLIGIIFIKDLINKKFHFYDKMKLLIFHDKILIICLIFLPILFVSLYASPSHVGINKINFYELFSSAIKSKIIIYSFIKEIPSWYLFFLIFIFFSKRKFEITFFFIINLMIYFSTRPELWGNAKYIIEFGLPFIILGHLLFTTFLIEKKKYLIAILLNISIFFLNIYEITNFQKKRYTIDTLHNMNFQKIIKSNDPKTKYYLKNAYNYKDGFNYIKKIKKQNNALLIGLTYGILPEILEGYSFNQLNAVIELKNSYQELSKINNLNSTKKMLEINKQENLKNIILKYFNYSKQNNKVANSIGLPLSKIDTSYDTKNLEKEEEEILNKLYNIKNLEFLLLADVSKKNKTIEFLTKKNWVVEKNFTQKKYNSNLILLKKLKE